MLNKNIKIKSLYSKSYNEYNKIQKLLISLRILFFKNNIYKKYIKNNYNKEIAFLEGPITTIFSSKNKNVKKIAWIHNDISLVFGNNIKSKIKKIINKKIYEKYQKLIFVSNHNLEKFNEFYNINIEKQVIHNYLNTENVLNKSKEFTVDLFEKNTINFVTVARLVEQKAIDRLICVHYKLISEGYKHKLYVVGSGPLKFKLEELINKLNISNTFILLGQKENPYPYILNSDYFCLLSYYEGLPMVLLEAKSLNKFILITDTASKEAVENYKNKKIFENSENGIYNGLKEIIKNNKNIKCDINTSNNENIEIINKIINILGE
ncbi:MAG: glycosyltransferase [Clostridia bacterium]|nr:glycosyltransferase [Clostridia bacterium]